MPQNIPFEAVIAILVFIALIILLILVKKIQSQNLKNELKDINVRFTAVKTVPLAFKLNKATYIAKINDELQLKVEEYRDKFDQCQKHLEQLQGLIDSIEDNIAIRNTRQAKESIRIVKDNLKDSEEEVNEIEKFLDSITEQEHVQREYSNTLKEEYRSLKQQAQKNIGELSFAYEGVEDRLKVCENLFSSFEEQIYANDFVKAQEDLEYIAKNNAEIRSSMAAIPELVHISKGVIPTLVDEVKREYDLTRQRGVYLGHMNVDTRLKEISLKLNECVKGISEARVGGIKEELEAIKKDLNSILENLAIENEAYDKVKHNTDKIIDTINDVEKTYNYIETVYNLDKEKYSLEELSDIINSKDQKIDSFKHDYTDLMAVVSANMTPATTVLEKSEKVLKEVREEDDKLHVYKNKIDKASNDENHALTQVVKLQIVLNEVEVKIAQYRLPAISLSYKEDLKAARDNINDLKVLLNAVPLNIPEINAKLKETIDFVYHLYNNVNNVVGMALMVENAIVLGNKYRSSYPEVDAELSKAEFAYLNGEYTQSLTIAIACIEKLFPKDGDQKIMEYAKGV